MFSFLKKLFNSKHLEVPSISQSNLYFPSTNIVLNWSDFKIASHSLDENLKSIKLNFSPDILQFDVSIVVKLNYVHNSHLISTFGSLKNFVEEAMNLAVTEFFEVYITQENYSKLEENKVEFQDSLKYELQPIFRDFGVEIVDTFMNTFKIFRKEGSK
jgi:hypothetical protein